MPIEIYRCDLCAREGDSVDLPCYSFIDPHEDCLYGNTDNPEWEPMHTEAELNEAVKAERRELLRLITEVIILPPVPKKMLIEAIRARGK